MRVFRAEQSGPKPRNDRQPALRVLWIPAPAACVKQHKCLQFVRRKLLREPADKRQVGWSEQTFQGAPHHIRTRRSLKESIEIAEERRRTLFCCDRGVSRSNASGARFVRFRHVQDPAADTRRDRQQMFVLFRCHRIELSMEYSRSRLAEHSFTCAVCVSAR